MNRPTREEIIAAYQDVGKTEAGRLMLADLEARFGFTGAPMFEGDVNQTVFRDGGRSVIAHIGKMLEASAEDQKEQANYD